MSVESAALDRCPEIARALAERVRDAARDLAHAAAGLVTDPSPIGGAAGRTADLRTRLSRLQDAAGFADLDAGRDIENVAADLALSQAAARRRFGGGPPALPLIAILADLDSDRQ